jgi:hypothetical protein
LEIPAKDLGFSRSSEGFVMRLSICLVMLSLGALACGTEDPVPDAGSDAGQGDAGRSDTGPSDASDAGFLDSGAPDMGVVPDAGAEDPGPFEWPQPTGPITVTPHASWKNRLEVPDDRFFFGGDYGNPDSPRWVKFTILVKDPTKVYFQHSGDYRFHETFAAERLDPFNGMSKDQIDARSLHRSGQELIFGAVLVPANVNIHEYAIQIVREDAYHPEQVRIIHDLVKDAIDTTLPYEPYYFPTYEQASEAAHWRVWLAARDVSVGSIVRWLTHDGCYAPGWALGRLVYVAGDQIDAAVLDGRLLSTDVLVTDAVPESVPFVAGILAFSPAAPSSQVAILAQSYGVPFAYLVDEAEQTRVRGLVGRDVLYESSFNQWYCGIGVRDLEGHLPIVDRDAILALKTPAAIAIRAKAPLGAISANVDGLVDADITRFGGKAIGYALLRATIPANTPAGVALSFDLWDRFLDQSSGNGTIRSEITTRLGRQSDPPNPQTLETDLAAIRAAIEGGSFDQATKDAIAAGLGSFDTNRRLRFRSSTNVEDDSFIGASLYDSATGCLADDLDADNAGPSACNPNNPSEAGVLRAIQKVYASFYSSDAVKERLRRDVDEAQVGMAVLVTYSYPDEDELASGVGSLVVNGDSAEAILVTQEGAVSISEPNPAAVPEVSRAYVGSIGIYFDIYSRSSLVPLGAEVMRFPEDYDELARLFRLVADGWELRHPGPRSYTLDFDFKKTAGGLIVKQVRRLPTSDFTPNVPTYYAAAPTELCIFQGESGDVFANHRNKVRLTLTANGSWLGEPELGSTLYSDLAITYVSGSTLATLAGAPGALPNASYARDVDRTIDGFDLGTARIELSTHTVRLARKVESAVKLPSDFWTSFDITHQAPVPTIDWQGVGTTSAEYISFSPCPDLNRVGPNNPRREDRVSINGVDITTSYWWPEPPRGPTAGYTAPLHRWDHTTITGLTTEPIELRGYWSQTQRPQHHNFSMDYIFEPALEPGISATTLEELTAANIKWIYTNGQELWVLGLDGTLRQL